MTTESVKDKHASLSRAIFAPNFIQPVFGEILIHPALLLSTNYHTCRPVGVLGQGLPLENYVGRHLRAVAVGPQDNGETVLFVARCLEDN